ncbi:MAG TPA: PAS domain-containing protein, partial [Sphingobacteriaceae bacterium]
MFDSDELVAILDHLSTPVAVYAGDDLVIRFANEPMLALWGRGGGVIGSPLKAVLPGGDSDPVISQLTGLRRSCTDRETGESLHRFCRDGELKWLSCRHEYKTLDQGPERKILHIINSARAGYPGRQADGQDIRLNAGASEFLDAGSGQDLISRFIAQAPAGICILGGPDMVFELVNPFYQQLFPGRQLLGRPLALAVPEIKDGPLLDILQDVYRTGTTFEGKDLLFPLRTAAGQVEDRYFTFIYQARRAADNTIDGVFVFVMDVTDAVLSRIKVQEQEMRLREMIMASHYGMMILQGRDMVIQVANQQIANLWRKGLDEIIGKKLIEVLPEIKDQPFPELLSRVYETAEPYGQQEEALYIQSPEGDVTRYVSFYYDPLLDSSGMVNSILVSCEDITEKVQSRGLLEAGHRQQQALNQELASVNRRLEAVNQEMLATNIELIQTQKRLQDSISVYEKSEHLMQSIVSNAPFPIGVYQGREMLVVMVNKALTDVWGKGENVVGKRYAEVLPELEDQHVFEQLDSVFTSGVPLHLRNQRIDLMVEGRMKAFYFNYSFTPLFDKDGEIYGVMNTAADVTDLYMAKQNLERSEQNLHNIILQAPVAMSILSGPEHIISVANNKMIELWGKPADAVMNKPVFEALPEAKDQGLEEHMENVYLGGESFQANEMPVTLIRNGMHEVVYQDFVYQPYRNAEGEIVGVIAITIDV